MRLSEEAPRGRAHAVIDAVAKPDLPTVQVQGNNQAAEMMRAAIVVALPALADQSKKRPTIGGMAPAAAIRTLLALLWSARRPSARAASDWAQALPSRRSSTSGAMAPASAISTWLGPVPGWAHARLPSARAAAVFAASSPSRKIPTCSAITSAMLRPHQRTRKFRALSVQPYPVSLSRGGHQKLPSKKAAMSAMESKEWPVVRWQVQERTGDFEKCVP